MASRALLGDPGHVAAHPVVRRVVILVQENHTTDNYLGGLAAYGVNVAAGWPAEPNPPAKDQPHDRHAYQRWLTKASTGAHVQFDTTAVLPFYAWLAATSPTPNANGSAPISIWHRPA